MSTVFRNSKIDLKNDTFTDTGTILKVVKSSQENYGTMTKNTDPSFFRTVRVNKYQMSCC